MGWLRWVLVWCVLWLGQALAGEPLLTLERGGVRQPVDEAMVMALPQHEITTRTPWYPGLRTFRGPRLADLLQQAGMEGQMLWVHALNDYMAPIPTSDLLAYSPILAHSINGERMSVRERGPFIIIYPFDQQPDIRNKRYYARSVWQVDRIRVE
ncbi:molybdopterin-dependent oxidoreductase [Aeromonas schubertii]|uniref:molybdopterin-dependent oxidoreductase n=1 Tax=Aeromonas TaxID=642 RepID=UPI0034A160AD